MILLKYLSVLYLPTYYTIYVAKVPLLVSPSLVIVVKTMDITQVLGRTT